LRRNEGEEMEETKHEEIWRDGERLGSDYWVYSLKLAEFVDGLQRSIIV
jgi:hypothetical protein